MVGVRTPVTMCPVEHNGLSVGNTSDSKNGKFLVYARAINNNVSRI